MILSLNDNWLMRKKGSDDELATSLPTNNYLTLISHGLISAPFYGTNEKNLLSVADEDYVFRKSFVIDKLSADEKYFLCLNDVDTLATITLNGKILAETSNVHLAYEFDVGPLLVEGENVLELSLASPLRYIERQQEQDKFPTNSNGLDGANHIRKASCQFGWDWGPVFPFCGIGNAEIRTYRKARLGDVKILQEHRNGTVELNFSVAVTEYEKSPYEIIIKITAPNGKTEIFNYSKSPRFLINSPILWWANGMTNTAKQPLYCIKAELRENDEILDICEKRIGLRTLVLDRKRDAVGENFCFFVNGKSVFAKGANWIPIDSFPQARTKEDLHYYIKAAANANMNMIRVWGGGYYGSDDFYDLCDEYGILVWQDFAFACMTYPFYDDKFLQSTLDEVNYNVHRLRHHPSLALWCGNNEIESMSPLWLNKPKLLQWVKEYFYSILPKALRQVDEVTPYIEGSPIGTSYCKGYRDNENGDTHMWQVWHGLRSLSYYRTRLTRFCSEFGLESLPSENAIRSFATEADFSLHSDVFNAHQKCGSGNDKMSYYLATKFNLPKNFLDLVYFTGLIQKECVSDASEHWRRNKGRCNGSLYWQLNDCWPTSSWSSIDYLGEYKALHYHAKHFFAPIAVSIENYGYKMGLYVLNDNVEEQKLVLRYDVIDFYGNVVTSASRDVNIAATSVEKVFALDCTTFADKKTLKNCCFVARLYKDGELISRKTCLFDAEKNLNLPQAQIETQINTQDGKHIITLRSDTFARAVMLSAEGMTSPFSDNYFDLLPKEKFVVTLDADVISIEELKAKLKIKSVADVDCDTSKLKNFALRLKIALKPKIFAHAIAYFIN